jgi:D-alanine-D-alanine ligase
MNKLALIFGGVSYEHEISIISAITLKGVLKSPLLYIFLDSNNELYLINSENMKSNFFQNGDFKKEKKISFIKNGFLIHGLIKKEILNVTFLNLIHGHQGEDGTLAGVFDFFNISYIGPRKEASIISFNKYFTKLFAEKLGIKTLKYEILNKKDTRVLKNLNLPVIVKPISLGSSLGIKVAKTKDEFQYALDVAFEFDSKIIIEEYIENIQELNLAGTKTDKLILSTIESPTKKGNILDFNTKYLDFSRNKKIDNLSINTDIEFNLKDIFKKIYCSIFHGSLIRCDFFVINNEIYLNEINSIPGSMANYLFDDFTHLIEKLVNYLPKQKNILIDYEYINSIQQAKGK